MGDLDKACLMDAGRKIIGVASREKYKTEQISDDCHDSITTLRVGFSYGDQSGYLFIAKRGVLIGRSSSISQIILKLLLVLRSL